MRTDGPASLAVRDAPGGASVYRAAIDATARAIQRRSRYYRNQVVVVVVLAMAAIAASLIARSPAILVTLLLLVPACGLFFIADTRALRDWWAEVAARWARRELDFAALRGAVRAHPALPKATTEAMLAMLPEAGDVAAEQRVLTPTRLGVASARRAALDRRVGDLSLATLASAVAVASIAAAILARSAAPLLGLGALALRAPLGARLRRRRERALEGELSACRGQPGFDEETYRRLTAGD